MEPVARLLETFDELASGKGRGAREHGVEESMAVSIVNAPVSVASPTAITALIDTQAPDELFLPPTYGSSQAALKPMKSESRSLHSTQKGGQGHFVSLLKGEPLSLRDAMQPPLSSLVASLTELVGDEDEDEDEGEEDEQLEDQDA